MRLKLHEELLFNINTEMGEISVFEFTLETVPKILESLECRIEDTEPYIFIKEFFRSVCSFSHDLDKGKYKPKKAILKKEDVERIKDDELENFAKKYIETNRQLLKNPVKKTSDENDDQPTERKKDKNYQQRNGESYVELLHRLLTGYYKEENARLAATTRKLMENAGYPTSLMEQMKKDLEDSNSFIKEAMKYADPMKEAMKYADPMKEAMKHASSMEGGLNQYANIDGRIENHLEYSQFEGIDSLPAISDTMDDVLKRNFEPIFKNLEELNESLVKAKGFMGKTYNTIVDTSSLLKISSRNNTIITFAGLIISALVLIISLWSMWYSIGASREQGQALYVNTKSIDESTITLSKNLKLINASLIKSIQENKTRFDQSNKEQIQATKKQTEELIKLMQKQNELLMGLNATLSRLPEQIQTISPEKSFDKESIQADQ